MGVVYAARDTELGRRVAIKLVRPRGESLDEAQARLRREAQAMARLSHPNAVTIHDIGVHGELLFIAMELVGGGTLRAWMQRPHAWREIASRMVSVGRGLAAAHSTGIVHRDFKPENVLIGTGGDVRIADFGLAAVAGDDDAAATPDGGPAAGTPAYMAPEQLRGAPAGAASDQFSFAVTFFEALEGRTAFRLGRWLVSRARRGRAGRSAPTLAARRRRARVA